MGSDDWNVEVLAKIPLVDPRAAIWCGCQAVLCSVYNRGSLVSSPSRDFIESSVDALQSWVSCPTEDGREMVLRRFEVCEDRILSCLSRGVFRSDVTSLQMCSTLLMGGLLLLDVDPQPGKLDYWLYAMISEIEPPEDRVDPERPLAWNSAEYGWAFGLSRQGVVRFLEFVDNLLKTPWPCTVPSAGDLLSTAPWAAVLWDQTEPIGDAAEGTTTLSDLVSAYERCLGPIFRWDDSVIRALFERGVL